MSSLIISFPSRLPLNALYSTVLQSACTTYPSHANRSIAALRNVNIANLWRNRPQLRSASGTRRNERKEDKLKSKSHVKKDNAVDDDDILFGVNKRVPRGFWQDPANHRRFFDWAAKRLHIKTVPDDWYRISIRDFETLLGVDNNSSSSSSNNNNNNNDATFTDATTITPTPSPPSPTTTTTTRTKSCTSTTTTTTTAAAMGPLARYYSNSLVKALKATYPEVEWVPWCFRESRVPNDFWNDPANQRRFLDWCAKQFGIVAFEDWYSKSLDDFYAIGQQYMIRDIYYGSLPNALAAVYPEFDWQPWLFVHCNVPQRYWASKANRRKYFDWLSRQLGIEPTTTATTAIIINNINNNNRNTTTTTNTNTTNSTATTTASTKAAFERGWYRVMPEELSSKFDTIAAFLSDHYDGSLVKALADIYPEVEWLPWRFAGNAPRNFWSKLENQRRYLDWIAKERLKLRTTEDWYRVSRDELSFAGGDYNDSDDAIVNDAVSFRTFLDYAYGGSLTKAVMTVYPEVDWLPWKFASGAPRGFWRNKHNQRRFLDWAAQQLGVRQVPDDWYRCRVSVKQIHRMGGAALLAQYGGSLVRALAAVYPEVEWDPWRYRPHASSDTLLLDLDTATPSDSALSSSSSSSSSSQASSPSLPPEDLLLRKYMERLASLLRIETLDEWYRASMAEIREIGGYNIIAERGGLYPVLRSLYPEHPWDERRFHHAKGKKSTQRRLRLVLQKLLPNEELLEEYEHPNALL